MKIKRGDAVLIISGKDRKKTAKILKVFPKEGKILVEGINLRKRHIRPKREGEKGQIISIPVPLSVSNVKFVCPKCGKAARLRYELQGEKKVRICKKCGSEV